MEKKTSSIQVNLPTLQANSNNSTLQTEPTQRSPKIQFGPSFSKARRFLIDHSLNNLGPGLYNTENSMLSPHLGTNLGIGKKTPVIFPHLLNNPGPGCYETIDLNNLKQSVVRGIKFSRSQHYTFEENIKAAMEKPSPGTYENNVSFFKLKIKNKKGTFGTADRYPFMNNQILGPGTYEVMEDFVFPQKIIIGERLGNSKAAAWKGKIKRKLPGPGQYEVKGSLESRFIKFGEGKRPEMFISKSLSPGPGAYNV